MDILNSIKKLSELYIKTRDKNCLQQIENNLKIYVALHPTDAELLIKLAIIIFIRPGGREDEAIEVLQQIPSTSGWHYKAVLIEAYIQEELRGVDKIMCDRLLMLRLANPELESMKYYMASGYFLHETTKEYRDILQQSVDLCRKHVWNLVNLGRTYQGDNDEYAKMLFCEALDNVESVCFSYKPDEDITDVSAFMNCYIKGLHLTTSHLQFIVNDLRPHPKKAPWQK